MYLERPEPLVGAICACVQPGGLVSVMALNAWTLAVRPALERSWSEALAAFDATSEVGVLGTDTRGDTCRRRRITCRCCPENTKSPSACTDAHVVRFTITPWLSPTSQPNARTAVALPSSVCSRHRNPPAASPSALISSSAAMNSVSTGESIGASSRDTLTCARSKLTLAG